MTLPLKAQKQNCGTLLPSFFMASIVRMSTSHSSQYRTALVTSKIIMSTPASTSIDMSRLITHSS